MWVLSQALAVGAIMLVGHFYVRGIYQRGVKANDRLTSTLVILFMMAWAGSWRLDGWPDSKTVDDLPDEFIFISGTVQEPDERYGSSGSIWMWIRVEDQPEVPKSVQLPYTKQLAHDVEYANLLVRKTGSELPVSFKVLREQTNTPPVINNNKKSIDI